MQKTETKRQQNKKISLPEPGSSPGMLYINPEALDTIITLHIYNQSHYKKIVLADLNELGKWTEDQSYYYWVDIKGFKSVALFNELGTIHNINPLVLEDITHENERPKIEEYTDYVFAVSRVLVLDESNGNVMNEQLSFILKENILFTLMDNYYTGFGLVEERIQAGKGHIRSGGPSYLMYAIMDLVIDHYYKILNSFSEKLDDIEDNLLVRPDKSVMYSTQQIKRKIIIVRRVIWPERDKLNDIIRSNSVFITADTKVFVRDAYDHAIQIIDVIESLKEIAANTIDMYLSLISVRMNEIMKVLTIISSIFIPLTFIAGIYGMNFSPVDPITNKKMPLNMPELYAEYGYAFTIGGMVLIAIFQMLYFWRKGWFR